MRRSAVVLFFTLLAAGTVCAHTQVLHSATAHQISITAGGMASIFQPDFEGDWVCVTNCPPPPGQTSTYDPVAHSSTMALFGVGAYVDVRLTRWVQLEAEGRWLRFNQYDNIHQDNYLIGPRLPVYHFWKATVYGKALGGFAKMQFDPSAGDHGKYTDLAFGGGVDVKLTKRLSLRVFDAEYQYYPRWGNSTLSPYGASVGFGYKIF